MGIIKNRHYILLSGACLAAVATPAAAQQTISSENIAAAASEVATPRGETSDNIIVVTANRRIQNVQDVPIAISAIDGDQLAATGATDLTDLVSRAPGLSFTRTARSNNRIAIRGLSSLVLSASDFPVVSSYVDEVPISESRIPDVGLLDLARVEVLRGPQGTLYGEGAMGGTVRFVTNKPDTNLFEGNVSGEYGSIRGGGDSYRVNGVLNLPIASDLVGLRIAGFYEDNGGFVTNVATGERNADAFDRYGGRASLLVTPSDRLSVTLTGMYQKFDGGLSPIVFREFVPGETPAAFPAAATSEISSFSQAVSANEDELYIFNGLVEYEFDFATLTSSTSYYDRKRNTQADELQTSGAIEAGITPLTTNPALAPIFEMFGVAGPFVVSQGTQVDAEETNQVFAQELRLVSNNDGPFSWTIGGYYREREVSSTVNTAVPDLIPVNNALLAVPPAFGGPLSGNTNFNGEVQFTQAIIDYRQYALFGEVQWEFAEGLTVTGGLRYLNERVEAQNQISAINAVAPGPDFFTFPNTVFDTDPLTQEDVLYKIGLSYQPNPDVLLYGQVANGTRPGGLNERSNPSPAAGTDSPLTFSSDSVVSYEVGAKTQFLDGALTANIAAYYTDWSDIQFNDSRDPQFPVTRNAASAEVKGIELELTARPDSNFEAGAVFSYIDAAFSEDSLPQTFGGNAVFLIEDGQRLPITPEVSVSFYGQWTYPVSDDMNIVTYGDVLLIDDRLANVARSDTARAGLSGTLDSYVEANFQIGLETERFTITAFVNNIFDEFAELGGVNASGISRNEPRTIGLRGQINF